MQGENPIVDSLAVVSEWTIVAKCALHGLIYMWDLKWVAKFNVKYDGYRAFISSFEQVNYKEPDCRWFKEGEDNRERGRIGFWFFPGNKKIEKPNNRASKSQIFSFFFFVMTMYNITVCVTGVATGQPEVVQHWQLLHESRLPQGGSDVFLLWWKFLIPAQQCCGYGSYVFYLLDPDPFFRGPFQILLS